MLTLIPEPDLLFAHDQSLPDPRDGLTLFGPLDDGKPYGVRAGVIGPVDSIARFSRYVASLSRTIITAHTDTRRPYYPGFSTAFRIPWNPEPIATIHVDRTKIENSVHLDDKYQRVAKTVDLFAEPLIKAARESEERPDVWFVVIPEEIHKYCRPQSVVTEDVRIRATRVMSPRKGRKLRSEPSLFSEDNVAAIPYQSEPDFHNQLKARLLHTNTPTQILRESTIAPDDFLKSNGEPIRKLNKVASDIAWNISSTAFYKCAGRPWKLSTVRAGVCYLGLVFKKDDRSTDPRAACCAAQLFLDSGDGLVFKGALGPWHTPKRPGFFHLKAEQASNLLKKALEAYVDLVGTQPSEVFIHGKGFFNDEEWSAFKSVATSKTKLVGVRIRDATDIKLYRYGT